MPSGMIVAVLGSDGSGKTTLIKRLQTELADVFPRAVVFHLRPYLLERNGAGGPVTNPHGARPHSLWLSCLKVPYYVLVYALGYLFKVRPALRRSTVVLFDRYYDDLLVDPRRYRYGGPIGLARFGSRFVRRPDLVLILDAPESELRKRKQEVSLDELHRQRNAYRKLASELPTAALLNSSLPAADVARAARDLILRHVREAGERVGASDHAGVPRTPVRAEPRPAPPPAAGHPIKARMLAHNTLLNLAGQLIPLILGVIAIPFIVRGLGVERFGLLSLAWVILGYFTIFDLGLGRATTKYVAEALGKDEREQIPGLIWTAAAAQGALGVLGALILVGVTPFVVAHVLHVPPVLVGEAKAVFYLLGVAIPVVMVSSSFSGCLEAAQRFDFANIVRIPSSAGTFLVPLIGLALGLKLPGIVALILALRLLALLAFGLFALRAVPELRTFAADFGIFPRLFAYGGWITAANILGPMLQYVDRFAVASLISLGAVAYYTAPFDMVTRLGIIPGSLVMTLFPAFSTLGASRKDDVQRLYVRSMKYLLLVTGPTVLLLLGLAGVIIAAWLGPDFAAQSTQVFRILLLGALVGAVAPISASLLQGLGRPDIIPKLYLVELPLNTALVLLLVHRMGLVGAALSFALRTLVDASLLFAISWRLVGLSHNAFRDTGFWRCLGVLLGLGMLLWTVSFTKASLWEFGVVAAFSLFLFAIGTWRYVLDSIDRNVVAAVVMRFSSPRQGL